MHKVVVQIKGGLGNQLFQYAAARRLAVQNNAELVLDTVTGFALDRRYKRRYMLDRFRVTGRVARPGERFEPFGRLRRRLVRRISRRRQWSQRRYVEQEGLELDRRLLSLELERPVYLDGYWQSEEYFQDIAGLIRAELRPRWEPDGLNREMRERIGGGSAVAVHVRWFDPPDTASEQNPRREFYQQAVARVEAEVSNPRYFVFSDRIEATRSRLPLPQGRTTYVSHNGGDSGACADLWLMSHCDHFVMANSTFSWWGAWLGAGDDSLVIAPAVELAGETSWGFKGMLPARWVKL